MLIRSIYLVLTGGQVILNVYSGSPLNVNYMRASLIERIICCDTNIAIGIPVCTQEMLISLSVVFR